MHFLKMDQRWGYNSITHNRININAFCQEEEVYREEFRKTIEYFKEKNPAGNHCQCPSTAGCREAFLGEVKSASYSALRVLRSSL